MKLEKDAFHNGILDGVQKKKKKKKGLGCVGVEQVLCLAVT